VATILAHIRVHPGREAEFERVASELWQRTHTDESHVRRYEYWRGAEPSTYYSLLAFDDFRGFLEHQTSPHHETNAPKLSDLVAELRLEWVDPLASASDLPSTEQQPLRPDASPLERTYHERYAAEVQDWWRPLRRGV
jgi:quinol monooxygenase YgiN